MRQLSSTYAYWLKRLFPIVWFGILAVVCAGFVGITFSHPKSAPPLPFLIMPVLMAVFGYFVFRRILFDLADEVFDTGDGLEVRNKGRSTNIPLADIINLDSSPYMNPPRIVLTLRTDTPLGRKIAFSPKRPFTLNPFASNPIADELIERIDQARRGRRG